MPGTGRMAYRTENSRGRYCFDAHPPSEKAHAQRAFAANTAAKARAKRAIDFYVASTCTPMIRRLTAL